MGDHLLSATYQQVLEALKEVFALGVVLKVRVQDVLSVWDMESDIQALAGNRHANMGEVAHGRPFKKIQGGAVRRIEGGFQVANPEHGVGHPHCLDQLGCFGILGNNAKQNGTGDDAPSPVRRQQHCAGFKAERWRNETITEMRSCVRTGLNPARGVPWHDTQARPMVWQVRRKLGFRGRYELSQQEDTCEEAERARDVL